MVKQIRDVDRKLVVQGQDNRSRGLVSCRLQQSTLYDHTRHHVCFGDNGEMRYQWHFLLTRDDGSVVCLQPCWKNTKIVCRFKEPTKDETVPKKGGIGGTDGPGTFRKHAEKQVDTELRFNAVGGFRRKNAELPVNSAAGWPWDSSHKPRSRAGRQPAQTKAAAGWNHVAAQPSEETLDDLD